MRTAEQIVIDDLDITIGRLKAMKALATDEEVVEACSVSQWLCETLRVEVDMQVELKNRLIFKFIPRKVNEVRGSLTYFEDLLMTDEGRKVYQDIDKTLMYIRDNYIELKEGEKQCKRTIVTLAI